MGIEQNVDPSRHARILGRMDSARLMPSLLSLLVAGYIPANRNRSAHPIYRRRISGNAGRNRAARAPPNRSRRGPLRGAVLIINGHFDIGKVEKSPETAESLFAPETLPPLCDPTLYRMKARQSR